MTTISGASEESAISVWGKAMIAQSQKAEAKKAEAKAAAEAANPGSTVVKLSDEAKAKAAAADWYKQSMDAIDEKFRIAEAQWAPAVIANGEDKNSVVAKLGSASAAEKEAFVQRELIKFDKSMAKYAVGTKYLELLEPGRTARAGSLSEKEIASSRMVTELFARGFIGHMEWINSGRPTEAVQQGGQSAAPVVRMDNGGIDALRLSLNVARQGMGVDTDADVQRHALSVPGLTELLAAAQQRIDALQSEYGKLTEIWKAAADRGEKWALPHIPDPNADNTGVNTFRYEESQHTYAPNIADLTLKTAKWSLAIIESELKDPELARMSFHSRYGDQVITDMKSYVIAAKDYISKLESGASPTAQEVNNGSPSTSG